MSAARHDGGAAIEGAIRRTTRSGRPALAAFLTAGFPRPESLAGLIEIVSRHVDVLELGVPFSDPMADGLTIQRSSRAALEAGVTLSWILEVVREARSSAPIVLMSYLNPLLAFGVERLAREAAGIGVSGLIVPDLPLEECALLQPALDDGGLALIQLVTPVTPPERLARLCASSRGFVYAVTSTGVTGGSAGHHADALEYLGRVREGSRLPVLAGFGVRTPEHLNAIAERVDGAIVGSALVETLERGEDPVAFLRGLRPPNATGKEGGS